MNNAFRSNCYVIQPIFLAHWHTLTCEERPPYPAALAPSEAMEADRINFEMGDVLR
jgi:hypothetical protein